MERAPADLAVLGIETSCDETAAAVVRGDRRILSSVVLSQGDLHAIHGGVVPEIAARAHLDHCDAVIRHALDKAGLGLDRIDAVAATIGPGLIGGLLVGAMTGKAIALARGLPFLGMNHLEGHALSARLDPGVAFPYLLLLASGGHCQFLIVAEGGLYTRLGTTIDDAAGEAFDKTAKLLGLGYPGGPALERLAARGDPLRFALPRPLLGRPGCDFSFADRTTHAIAATHARGVVPTALVVAGGVAANTEIRDRLAATGAAHGLALRAPPLALCTDNAAMIAWAGIERLRRGERDALDIPARPRWPLDPAAA
jgi:N6-L-threonylcarbamoyladenine synthase